MIYWVTCLLLTEITVSYVQTDVTALENDGVAQLTVSMSPEVIETFFSLFVNTVDATAAGLLYDMELHVYTSLHSTLHETDSSLAPCCFILTLMYTRIKIHMHPCSHLCKYAHTTPTSTHTYTNYPSVAPGDYGALTRFRLGQFNNNVHQLSFNVSIVNDNTPEDTKMFNASLTIDSTDQARLGNRVRVSLNKATVTIQDNDGKKHQ